MAERVNSADIVADAGPDYDAGPTRLCAACADPKRPLDQSHGNVKFPVDCYGPYRRTRNAQYKRSARRRVSGADDYNGVIMSMKSVTLPARAVMELTALAGRLQDQARLLSAESLEINDVDAPERMVTLADRILTEAEAVHRWLMDQLPQPDFHTSNGRV